MKRKEGGQKIWRVSAEMENRSHFLPIFCTCFCLVFFFCLCVIALDASSGPRWHFSRQGFFSWMRREESVCVEDRGRERERGRYVYR